MSPCGSRMAPLYRELLRQPRAAPRPHVSDSPLFRPLPLRTAGNVCAYYRMLQAGDGQLRGGGCLLWPQSQQASQHSRRGFPPLIFAGRGVAPCNGTHALRRRSARPCARPRGTRGFQYSSESYVFEASTKEWGWPKFAALEELRDARRGFLAGDALRIEVGITVREAGGAA
ncbi:MAG: hypothetical protein J3K34DRAFT_146147 [Monoraphidium minutum]|nr:MAG: hypothetical protein J3K34DRAFT_146147 [Monoraphidium minutum]